MSIKARLPKQLDLPNLESEEDCWFAIDDVYSKIVQHHGPAVAKRLFIRFIGLMQGRRLQQAKNDRLMARYIKSGLSIKRFAALVVKQNKSLPQDARHGPNGSINAESLEKHIQRQLKLLEREPRRRTHIEELAKYITDIS